MIHDDGHMGMGLLVRPAYRQPKGREGPGDRGEADVARVRVAGLEFHAGSPFYRKQARNDPTES